MSPNFDELREKVSAPMRRPGVVRAGIFGSVARGEAGEGSDVDFLVELEKGRTLVDLAGQRYTEGLSYEDFAGCLNRFGLRV